MFALKSSSGKPIVACTYGDATGTLGAFLTSHSFHNCWRINGQEGAKKILLQHREQVATVDFPQGAIDIDTNGDYEQLLTGTK